MASTIQPNEVGINNQPGGSNANGQPGINQQQPNQGFQSYNPKQQGTGYTNIQNVVAANQNNQLGKTIGNNVSQAGQSLSNNVNNAQQQFQTQSAANQFDTDQNQQFTQNALSNPSSIDPSQYNQFSNLMSGNYQGPTGLTNADTLQNQAQNVQQQNQALGTQQGRVGLLNQYVGGPNYTQGQQQLDSLLLGQTGAQNLNQARQATQGSYGNVQNAIQGAQNTAQANTANAQQFGNQLQNQFANTVQQQNQALTSQAATDQSAKDAQFAKIQSDLASGNITPQEASLLGLTQGENVYNTLQDTSGYLSEDPTKATAQNVASQQQYANLQALQQMAGQYSPAQAAQTLAQYNNPSQAGSFQNTPAAQANLGTFQQSLQNANQGYNNDVGFAQTSYNRAQAINDLLNNPNIDSSTKAWTLKTQYPEAAGGNFSQNLQWAQNNLATQQANFAAAQAAANAKYGNEQINIGQQPVNNQPLADNSNAFNVK